MIVPEIVKGDLLDQEVEAIVNAWNRNAIPWWLLLMQGVSGAIKARGGTMIFREVAKAGIIPLGGAVLTKAGELPFKGIIHVAGINLFWMATERSVRQAVRSAMEIVRHEGFRSVAFPVIGAGVRNQGWVLRLMLDEFQQLSTDARVVIVLYPRFKIRLNVKKQCIEYRENGKSMDVPAQIYTRGFRSVQLLSWEQSIVRWNDDETPNDRDRKRIFDNIAQFCEKRCDILEVTEETTFQGTPVQIREYLGSATTLELLKRCRGLNDPEGILFLGHIASADLDSPEIPAIREQLQAFDWQGTASRPAANSVDYVNWSVLLRAEGSAAVIEIASREELWSNDTISLLVAELPAQELKCLLPHIRYWTRLKPGATLPGVRLQAISLVAP